MCVCIRTRMCVSVCVVQLLLSIPARYNNSENTQPQLAIKGIRCPPIGLKERYSCYAVTMTMS